MIDHKTTSKGRLVHDDTPDCLCYDCLCDRVASLKSAIRRHRDFRGDDRCWLDDVELYESLGELIPGDGRRLPSPVEMLENCKRFVESRHPMCVPYLSPQRRIDDLEKQLMEARAEIARLNRDNGEPIRIGPPYPSD